ncbi:hypothetical protein A3A05_02885 [Candidatus Nomurabacteria bacterium RIFCSPLOWO2_01_FULL_41_12]|uniref:Uncharacterized protein n=1 Tax=Candidatus Nomurabacteria bacterium RIFCSPLOWO2_01_FULL_41_12 TaxID=1801774 RepID=A0A1F6WX69_9BACT|nr:MAG: hypothetical protein A3A05_02885 [Candidatus Nomurabacteria bacterium RIFCSPLOWO2_01_FULL_41_12]
MNTKTETKICVDCKNEFEISSGDLNLYEKVGLVIPEQCFFCRTKQYLAFFIFGKFRKGISDLSGESLITVLPNNLRYPIYKSHEWWGDGWNPMNFGQEYDENRPFFDQLKELQEKIPRPHQVGKNNTGCDWCDDVWDSKNCYLCRSLSKCENLSYSYRVVECKDSFDLVYCFNLQNSYDSFSCHNSFNLNFSENCKDCIDSYFLFDCRNCQNCIMSWNLRNKQYYIRNKQYTKEAYEAELVKIGLDSYQNVEALKNEFKKMLQGEAVHRENFNLKTTDSVGNYLTNCDKCVNVFTWETSQNCRNSLRGMDAKDCIDQFGSWHTEASGNNSCVYGGYQLKHSSWSNARYSEYLDLCDEVEYCFGCVGLRKKKYCILNKQYEKDEYENLRNKIINNMEKRGEYGKFLPYSFGLCEYNFSAGAIYFKDITEKEIVLKGGYWKNEDLSSQDGILSASLPDSIIETDPSIKTQALICPESHYRFNISEAEYEFHKRKNFALPRLHFDLRMTKQMRKITVIKSYPYKCMYCENDIMAYYPPEWGYQKIACEECYKQNIA